MFIVADFFAIQRKATQQRKETHKISFEKNQRKYFVHTSHSI